MIAILIKALEALSQALKNYQNKNMPNNPIPNPTPAPVPTPASVYDWSTPAAARLSVRELCDAMGMPLAPSYNVGGRLYLLKDVLCACVQVESGFNPHAVHLNKVPKLDTNHRPILENGQPIMVLSSTDYGIVQVNDYWNIGPGKPFPSSDYVLENPEACVRWMIKMFLAGRETLWASYTTGAFKKYLPA